MKAYKNRCPLPFVILLAALWLTRCLSISLSDGLPDRKLALVESPAQVWVQVIPGTGG